MSSDGPFNASSAARRPGKVSGDKSQLSPCVPTGLLMPALLQGASARIRRRGRHSHDLIRAIANYEELSRLVVVARSMIRDGVRGWVLVLARQFRSVNFRMSSWCL